MECPECGSPHVYVHEGDKWICRKCEHQWESKVRPPRKAYQIDAYLTDEQRHKLGLSV